METTTTGTHVHCYCTINTTGTPCCCQCGTIRPKTVHMILELDYNRGCPMCAGEMVFIRARYPHGPQRHVCPTCMADRMENIREITDSHYGIANAQKEET